ncbi:MAG: hypothetical protein RLZZ574_233, partial [Cyanobacteriota bacterium]
TQLQLRHQQIGYATTVTSGMSTDLKQINTHASLFLCQQPTNNFSYQTSLVQMTARDELNFVLNYQLPQALQSQIKST